MQHSFSGWLFGGMEDTPSSAQWLLLAQCLELPPKVRESMELVERDEWEYFFWCWPQFPYLFFGSGLHCVRPPALCHPSPWQCTEAQRKRL